MKGQNESDLKLKLTNDFPILLQKVKIAKRQKMSALQLEDLPEEMILTVFTYLDIRDLMSCGQVSKRLRQIWNIESLWQTVDLQDIYQVKTDFIKFLLEKGCKCLNLYGTKLKGSLKLDKPSMLEHLNLEECSGKQALKEILNSCHSLQKVAFQVKIFFEINETI